jgi:oligopeptide/dipeptide ABC transporter ATP-binding protein
MGSLPRLDVNIDRLYQIPGQPPSLLNPPAACRFHPRCAFAMPVCREKDPRLVSTSGDPEHEEACHLDPQTKSREAAALVSTLTAGVEA